MKKLLLLACLLLFYMGISAQPLDVVAPEAVGLDASRLANADRAIEQAITDKTIPGAVLCVERHRVRYGFVQQGHVNGYVRDDTRRPRAAAIA